MSNKNLDFTKIYDKGQIINAKHLFQHEFNISIIIISARAQESIVERIVGLKKRRHFAHRTTLLLFVLQF